MKTAAVLKSGSFQALRPPKNFQFDVNEVEILRRGDEVVPWRVPRDLSAAFHLLASLPEDFMKQGRVVTVPQAREDW